MKDRQPTGGSPFLEESVRAYYASSHATALAAVAGGALVGAAFWTSPQRWVAVGWVLLLGLVAVLRVVTGECYHRRVPAHWPVRAWARLAYGIPVLMGATWGLGAFWMLGVGDQHQLLVLICVSIGAVMGSISNAVYWPAHIGFFAPLMALLAAGLAWHGVPERVYLIPGALLITVLMAIQGRAVGRRLIATLQLAAENQQLAERLSERTRQLEQANADLAALSHTDMLTGLCNRRGWIERLEAEWARAIRQRQVMGMLVIDIDHFKQYNDTYGHSAGDVCIARVASVFKAQIRAGTDLAARYGGEEFAVLLPGMDPEALYDTAERIRLAVAALHAQGDAGLCRPLTISIGMAWRVPDAACAMHTLFDAADEALYQAKQQGRNRVCQAPSAPC